MLRGDRTIQEIAAKHQVHPNQVSAWKYQAIGGFDAVFLNGADAGLLLPRVAAAGDANSIETLQQQIDQLNNQVADLKRSQNAQYTDIKAEQNSGVKVTLKNGRPKFATADGDFTAELRAFVQYDSSYYAQGKAPSVFVIHDQDEAFALADLVAVMNKGKIEQYGIPAEVKRTPGIAFVREFLDLPVATA